MVSRGSGPNQPEHCGWDQWMRSMDAYGFLLVQELWWWCVHLKAAILLAHDPAIGIRARQDIIFWYFLVLPILPCKNQFYILYIYIIKLAIPDIRSWTVHKLHKQCVRLQPWNLLKFTMFVEHRRTCARTWCVQAWTVSVTSFRGAAGQWPLP